MSCYVPYCISGVPYFSVLTKCGFEEQGGIVDCIQPINMSGINELLVSQGGSAMSRHRPERLHELEALLEFPPQVSAAELDGRFRDLCKVIEKARDTFSYRLEEGEQENPFQELHVQLQKAKDRFHVRLAGENNNTKPLRSSRFKTKSSSKNVQNPFQELRDAFRMARKHFIPLIDQYVSTGNNNSNSKAIRDQTGSRLGGHYQPNSVDTSHMDSTTILSTNPMEDSNTRTETGSVEINKENAVESCCTIPSMNPIEDCSKPQPSNASEEMTPAETVCVEINKKNAVDCFRTIPNMNPVEDCSKMQPSISCNEMSSRETISVEINRDNADHHCTILSENSIEDCSKPQPSSAPEEMTSGVTVCVEINEENAVDCCHTILSTNPMEDCSRTQPSNAPEEMTSGETVCVEINKENAVDCCDTILSTNPMEDYSKMQHSNECNEVSSRETISDEANEDNVLHSCTITNENPTDDCAESQSLNSCNEVNPGAPSTELLREGTQSDSFSDAVTNPNQSTVSRLEALITKELQRRKGGLKLLENQDLDLDDGYRLLIEPITKPAVEGEADTFEQLSSTC